MPDCSQAAPTCAGENQVAHASQAPHCQGVSPQSNSQACDFHQASRDEGSTPIVAESQTIRDAAGNGKHILEGSTQLHTCRKKGDFSGKVLTSQMRAEHLLCLRLCLSNPCVMHGAALRLCQLETASGVAHGDTSKPREAGEGCPVP